MNVSNLALCNNTSTGTVGNFLNTLVQAEISRSSSGNTESGFAVRELECVGDPFIQICRSPPGKSHQFKYNLYTLATLTQA